MTRSYIKTPKRRFYRISWSWWKRYATKAFRCINKILLKKKYNDSDELVLKTESEVFDFDWSLDAEHIYYNSPDQKVWRK